MITAPVMRGFFVESPRDRLLSLPTHGICVLSQCRFHEREKMNAPRKSKLDPIPAYETAHLVAQDLLQRVRELLQDQPAPENSMGDSTPIHWGHVGQMCEVNQRLASVVAFLDGTER